MRVLVAMSGGVDSSVAAAILRDRGHEVVGATMKLWGGRSDSGCCSVADVEDARSVAGRLGIDHHVFNFGDEFERHVVGPYVLAHAEGLTPNPCIECNRHIKFGRLLGRAERLGFDAVATGHHARVAADGARHRLLRGLDRDKDQSYVLSMLTGAHLARLLLPIGELTKKEVRETAAGLGLRTAAKPDSQDVCFIKSRTEPAARASFLAQRIDLHPGEVLDVRTGERVGEVGAVELVTVGQRRGLGGSGSGSASGAGAGASGRAARRYVVAVDTAGPTVLVGTAEDLLSDGVTLRDRTWTHGPLPAGEEVLIQCSAHGAVRAATVTGDGVHTAVPGRKVAPGQTVALYDGDEVVGSGIAA